MRIHEPTPQQEAGWKKWVAERPDCVREVAERFDPWTLYRMKSTGQHVTVYSISEHGDETVSITVNVTRKFNPEVIFERQVFGIDPDDLVIGAKIKGDA